MLVSLQEDWKPEDFKTEDWPIAVNIGRPSFHEEEHFVFMEAMHNWFETCDIPMVPNGAYSMICDFVRSRKGYMGGGHQYCFFFKTKEDAKKFQDHFINEKWAGGILHMEALNPQNRSFLVDNEGKVEVLHHCR